MKSIALVPELSVDDGAGSPALLPPRWLALTVQEAAVQLRISDAAMWRLIAADQVATVKIGRCRRVPVAALEDYLRRLMEVPNGAASQR